MMMTFRFGSNKQWLNGRALMLQTIVTKTMKDHTNASVAITGITGLLMRVRWVYKMNYCTYLTKIAMDQPETPY